MGTRTGRNNRGDHLHSPGVINNSALTGFRFNFSNGGHQIKKIGVLAEESHLQINFEDSDGSDPISYLFRYHGFASHHVIDRMTFSGDGSNSTTVDLGEWREDAISLLRGFQLAFTDGNDHEITEIGIRLREVRGREEAVIVFRDHDDTTATFQFVLQVLWVMKSAFYSTNFLFDSTSLGVGNVPINARPPELEGRFGVIRGFNYRYVRGHDSSDDSHYIQSLDGDLGNKDSTPGLNGALLSLHDGDRDDNSFKKIWAASTGYIASV